MKIYNHSHINFLFPHLFFYFFHSFFFLSKILSADLAIQVDEEKKKIFVLRRRLQKYAEKMAAMELATVVQGLKKIQVIKAK